MITSFYTNIAAKWLMKYLLTKDIEKLKKEINTKRSNVYGHWAYCSNPIYDKSFLRQIKSIISGSFKKFIALRENVDQEEVFLFDPTTFIRLDQKKGYYQPILEVVFHSNEINVSLHTHYYKTCYDSFDFGRIIKQWNYTNKQVIAELNRD